MAFVDAFNTTVFSMRSMMAAFDKLPYSPGRIRQMGLFQPRPLTTHNAVLEEMGGILTLLNAKERGGDPNIAPHAKRTARPVTTLHIPYDDFIYPKDIQGVRAMGSESEVQMLSNIVNSRLQQMKQDHETTLEFLLFGALQGSLLDADGTTELLDLYTAFNVSQTSVDFNLNDGTTADVRLKCMAVRRAVESGLGNFRTYDHIHGFAGETWFEAFINHENVKKEWRYGSDGGDMNRSDPRFGYKFGGLVIEEYSHTVDNVRFIAADEAIFFPVGSGLPIYKIGYSPMERFDSSAGPSTVNTPGQAYYVQQFPDMKGRWHELHTEQNPLPVCLRPQAIVKGTTS